ncbi:MAG TPA: 6-phosphogluconolactonase [Myxococcota bacterium]|nr:6-phosphogluconolactonase [Myxococcota bacterium]
MTSTVSRLRDADDVARVAAGEFAEAAREAVRGRGRFCVALSGGDTPRRLHRQLATDKKIEWSRAEIFLGDERAVPPEHPESNYRMVRETLLDPAGIDPVHVHRVDTEVPNLDVAARDYEAEIARVLGAEAGGTPPSLDLVLLGLGADGHTASLFPHSPALSESRRWVVPNEAPGLARRITMTFPLLLRARRLLVLVDGETKAGALHEVLEGAWNPEHFPAQRLREARDVRWLVDAAAARRLRGAASSA